MASMMHRADLDDTVDVVLMDENVRSGGQERTVLKFCRIVGDSGHDAFYLKWFFFF
jgi:hypothetical protein